MYSTFPGPEITWGDCKSTPDLEAQAQHFNEMS